jgi:hypothetical protein
MSNLVAERVEAVLTPIVGSVLASVSVDLETRRIGKDRDTLTSFDLPMMADNLANQLKLVVGPDVAAAAAQKVRDLG